MRTAFLAATIVLLAEFLAYAQDPVTPQEWHVYVRTPYVLGSVYKNDDAFMLQGQAPLELTPLPGKKKVILAYHLPRGEKKDVKYHEKILINQQFMNTIPRKAGAARRGGVNLKGRGLRYQFYWNGKLVVHVVKGKFTAEEYQAMPNAAETIRSEVHDFCQTYIKNFDEDFSHYGFIVFAEKYGKKDGDSWLRWTPSISKPERTAIVPMAMLDPICAGTSVTEQMAYMGFPNPMVVMLSKQQAAEILSVAEAETVRRQQATQVLSDAREAEVVNRELAAQIAIGASLRYLLEALGCPLDKHPRSVMNDSSWHWTNLHFSPRPDITVKPTYISPDSMKIFKDWVE